MTVNSDRPIFCLYHTHTHTHSLHPFSLSSVSLAAQTLHTESYNERSVMKGSLCLHCTAVLCLWPSSHIFLSLSISLCVALNPPPSCYTVGSRRGVSQSPRVLYLESVDDDVETQFICWNCAQKDSVHYFCRMMREQRKHARRKIMSLKSSVRTFTVCVFGSDWVHVAAHHNELPFLRHSSLPFVIHLSFWYLCSHRNGWQWTLSLPPAVPLVLLCVFVIYHAESMFTSDHMTTHALCCLHCLSPSIHPSLSILVATHNEITNSY